MNDKLLLSFALSILVFGFDLNAMDYKPQVFSYEGKRVNLGGNKEAFYDQNVVQIWQIHPRNFLDFISVHDGIDKQRFTYFFADGSGFRFDVFTSELFTQIIVAPKSSFNERKEDFVKIAHYSDRLLTVDKFGRFQVWSKDGELRETARLNVDFDKVESIKFEEAKNGFGEGYVINYYLSHCYVGKTNKLGE